METEKSSGYSVLLRNLQYTTTTQVVRDAFGQFGKIRDVYLPLDFTTKRPRGFGFVEFNQEEDAIAAVKAMDNTEFDGATITCCLAQDRRKSPNSMRRAYRLADTQRRYVAVIGSEHDPCRGDHYSRHRSRSRSHGAQYARRSFSYERRSPPPRDDYHYHHRREYDHSPARYDRSYAYERDYRTHRDRRDHRGHRPGYLDHEDRRYLERSYPGDYPRHMHERRRSPLRDREPHLMERVSAEQRGGPVRRSVRKNP
ncbi:RNA recognition motif containing protein [Babesia divergens]|uniref:RNA recognition motif containing protein n=1 Tax=Babesia divergens TaxID=32595 RepID=A0AAD9LJP7_BABDI|nr:RNA recognition motif containing protein [Babesia divergens]